MTRSSICRPRRRGGAAAQEHDAPPPDATDEIVLGIVGADAMPAHRLVAAPADEQALLWPGPAAHGSDERGKRLRQHRPQRIDWPPGAKRCRMGLRLPAAFDRLDE